MRTSAQGYSAADNVRQRYADTRLDDATGLDHTLWRKLETRSGRWTTPDPYGLSMEGTDPQSFNRYGYVRNDPVNIVDPSGLRMVCPKDRGNIIYVCHEEPGGGLPGSGPIDGSGNRPPNDRRETGAGPGGGPQNPSRLDKLLNGFVSLDRDLLNGQISDDCRKNVVDKLASSFSDFNYGEFARFFNTGTSSSFQDGTTSGAPIAGTITGAQAAAILFPGSTSISDAFASNPGLQALTSITSSTLSIFLRPGAINTSNNGNNADNKALLFHEAIHGYGGTKGGTSYFDDEVQKAFGLKVDPKNTGNITDYIKKQCF